MTLKWPQMSLKWLEMKVESSETTGDMLKWYSNNLKWLLNLLARPSDDLKWRFNDIGHAGDLQMTSHAIYMTWNGMVVESDVCDIQMIRVTARKDLQTYKCIVTLFRFGDRAWGFLRSIFKSLGSPACSRHLRDRSIFKKFLVKESKTRFFNRI